MRLCVIREQMPRACDRSRNLRPGRDETSNQEERCLDVVPCKNFKQSLGVNIVRTVIVSEREMPGIRKVSYGVPIKLRLGGIAVIREIACAGEDTCDS